MQKGYISPRDIQEFLLDNSISSNLADIDAVLSHYGENVPRLSYSQYHTLLSTHLLNTFCLDSLNLFSQKMTNSFDLVQVSENHIHSTTSNSFQFQSKNHSQNSSFVNSISQERSVMHLMIYQLVTTSHQTLSSDKSISN